MRTALALPVGLALAFAPGRASADSPHVAMRLEYVRSAGGQACPAEATTLRAEVAARMGYDPFEATSAPERLAVVLAAKGGGFVARVERFNAAGESTWSETFPPRPLQGDCEALMSPLASYLRASFLSYQGGPTAPPAAPPPESAAPRPAPSPPIPPSAMPPELHTPPAQPAKPPEPANVPNPTRATARNVAIVAYAAAGAFLGLGIAWTVDARNKGNTARALAAQPDGGGYTVCMTGGAPSGYCSRLLGAVQSQVTATDLRNGWFTAAGVSAAIGTVATFVALELPTTSKAQAQISFTPGGLVLQGTF
jgi:hypothetical protein